MIESKISYRHNTMINWNYLALANPVKCCGRWPSEDLPDFGSKSRYVNDISRIIWCQKVAIALQRIPALETFSKVVITYMRPLEVLSQGIRTSPKSPFQTRWWPPEQEIFRKIYHGMGLIIIAILECVCLLVWNPKIFFVFERKN